MDGSSFFVLTKIKTERMNRMKNKPNLWNSVSVLVVAVLIVHRCVAKVLQKRIDDSSYTRKPA